MPGWREAMARRGITDLDLVCPARCRRAHSTCRARRGGDCCACCRSCSTARPTTRGRTRSTASSPTSTWSTREVVKIVDDERLPIPVEEGNFDDPAFVGPDRTTQRPIEITQPEGPSFTVDGDVVTWEGWTFRVGFDPREGLVLHQLAMHDRPIVYRASVAEMVVPYGDPGPVRFWQNYFDAGEYLLGQQVNSLALGCDCLGEIHYFDAVLADSAGEPRTVAERDLHARGGLRRAVEAHRPVHRVGARRGASAGW